MRRIMSMTPPAIFRRGTFSTVVQVGDYNVTVTGAFVNGAPRIGTAYIPP